MTLAVADISNHQSESWRPASNEKIVFVLTSDGHSWFSPDHDDQVKLLRSLKRRVGHYHWLRPGNIQAQVDWFWAHAKPKAGDAVIVDWEQAGTSNADKDNFLKLLDAKIPRTKILKRRKNQRLLYCNKNYWLNYDRTSFVGEGLWIAAYDVSDPGIQHPWTFWQYTDSPYDRSHSIFPTLKAYDAWANPTDGTVPSPAPALPAPIAPYPGPIAVARALAMVGKPYGIGWCQKFTNEIFGTGPVGDYDHDKDADAVDGWKAAKANGKVVTADKIKKLTDIPAGVMLYWTGGSHGYGHAAVAVGNGQMVSTDLPVSGKVGKVPITAAHDSWGLTFAGYVLVEGNGFSLLPSATPKPAPKPAPAPAPTNQEELDVAEQKPTKHRTTLQHIPPTKGGKSKTLLLENNGDCSWAFGPGRYYADVKPRFRGADPGDELVIRAALVDTDKSGKVVKISKQPDVGLGGSDGKTFSHETFRWYAAAPEKGLTRRLRFLVENYSDHVIDITDVITTVWEAPL